jgi:hypothetical protein
MSSEAGDRRGPLPYGRQWSTFVRPLVAAKCGRKAPAIGPERRAERRRSSFRARMMVDPCSGASVLAGSPWVGGNRSLADQSHVLRDSLIAAAICSRIALTRPRASCPPTRPAAARNGSSISEEVKEVPGEGSEVPAGPAILPCEAIPHFGNPASRHRQGRQYGLECNDLRRSSL